jgi:hypothetical protein
MGGGGVDAGCQTSLESILISGSDFLLRERRSIMYILEAEKVKGSVDGAKLTNLNILHC